MMVNDFHVECDVLVVVVLLAVGVVLEVDDDVLAFVEVVEGGGDDFPLALHLLDDLEDRFGVDVEVLLDDFRDSVAFLVLEMLVFLDDEVPVAGVLVVVNMNHLTVENAVVVAFVRLGNRGGPTNKSTRQNSNSQGQQRTRESHGIHLSYGC